MNALERRVGWLSAVGYTAVSLASALAFFGIARWVGEALPLAVLGGTGWVFILSMIVSMPVVTGLVRRRMGGRR